MAAVSNIAFEQKRQALKQGDHFLVIEHARRDEKLAGSRRGEGGIGLDQRFDLAVVIAGRIRLDGVDTKRRTNTVRIDDSGATRG